MTDMISRLSAAAHPLNTDGVTAAMRTEGCDSHKCEFPLYLGLFFDGTGNNQYWVEPNANGQTQLERQKDSNVARLYRAYPLRPMHGYYRIYVPGVGTPFKDVGDDDPRGNEMGMGFGAGGEARILFGLLSVLNTMNISIQSSGTKHFSFDTIRALCSNDWLPIQTDSTNTPLSPSTQWALDQVGMKDRGGLLTLNGISLRTEFLKEQFALLAQKITDTKCPKLREVMIDVFGFSRGAAQARVFCNWLAECFEGDKLAGVTTHIRFLGIFDTVAAVGLGPAAAQWANGHQAWGDEANLKISPRVNHCEHYVAMHEQRQSFPLEDVHAPGEAMPANCRQYRFPGMHSDLGGSYLPSEQGKNPPGADDDKLSQLPLNRMFEAAQAANIPLTKKLAFDSQRNWDPFAISAKVQAAYDAFMQANGLGERMIADCLIDILAWRYQNRSRYDTLLFMAHANPADRDDLLSAHHIFLSEIAQIDQHKESVSVAEMNVDTAQRSLRGIAFKLSAAEKALASARQTGEKISDQAWHIYGLLIRQLSEAEKRLFADYCHDSYAGFKPYTFVGASQFSRHAPWEDGGYLRYRARYAGDDLRLSQIEPDEPSSRTA